jgi:hypothetical protein
MCRTCLVRSEMAGNNQSMFSSLTPCGKKAMTPRSSRASGPSSRNIGEASESSIVAARLLECCAWSTPVRCLSHSLVSRLVSHLLCCATVASNVTESGWKSSCSRISSIRSDCSPCLYMRWNVSRAASIDNGGISRVSQSGGMVEIREVMQRQMLLNRVSSSTVA